MLFRTHFVFGIFIGFLLLLVGIFNYNFSEKILFLVFVLLGTIIVDIDSRKSVVGRFFLFRPLQWSVSHRGIFHTLIFSILISSLIFVINSIAGWGFFVGYVGHLFLDMLTKRGVKLFWPLFKFKIGFGIKSGGLVEEVLFVLLLLADIWLFVVVVF